jgi:DNA-binding response OmpR family regulator
METVAPNKSGTDRSPKYYTVLVIDDEEDMRRLIKHRLTRSGYRVFEASNGMEGIQQMYKVHPHLVILDIMMPRMDGWETCRRIREFSNVPILILSAKGDWGSRVKGLDLGANDYLSKPFSLFELLKKIEALLARFESQDEPQAKEETVTG